MLSSWIQERVYPRLPISIQNFAISVFGYFWNRRRFGGIFSRELIGFKERENYSSEQWTRYQTDELRKILVHAFTTVPFYTEKYSNAGLNIDDFKNFQLKDITRLPCLEKDELRQFGKTTLLSSKLEKGGDFYSSSGSTGTPTQILISPQMHQAWTAGFEVRIRNWAGLTNKSPRGTIGGRRIVIEGISKGPFYRYNIFEKQVYFSAYHISRETVGNYIEGMIKHKIEYMTGYAMSNFFLARLIEESGLKAPKLKAVITSSEKLTEEMRDTFKRVYGCKTYDSYSGVEDCGMITECEFENLHISPDLGVIEILNNEGVEVKAGEVGEAVCTGLLNFNQPLIRYRIGDNLKLSNDQLCKCGRSMPVIDEIMGRIEDTVIGPDGRELVRFHGIFINIPEIIEAQVIQHELNLFEIRLVTSKILIVENSDLIINRMRSQLGNVEITINYVDKIARNNNGKFKAVISHVKRRN